MTKRSHQCWPTQVGVDGPNACKRMQTIAVHCARATDSFPAGSPERQCRIHVLLDVDESIQVHGGNFLQIDVVADVFGFIGGIFRVILVDEESLHGCFLLGSERRVMLLDVVRVHVALDRGGHAFEENRCF